MPITNKAWLSWLNSHQEEFQEELRTATSKRRALYNRKLEAISDLEEVSRLVPKASPLPPWASRMLYGRHGHFFYIKWSSGARLAVVSSSISSNCWAAELSPVPCTNGYEFGFDTSAWLREVRKTGNVSDALQFPTRRAKRVLLGNEGAAYLFWFWVDVFCLGINVT